MRTPSFRVLSPLLALLLVGALPPRGAAADGAPEGGWKPGEVARVGGRSVTWGEVCAAAVDESLPELPVAASVPAHVLSGLVEDVVLAPLLRAHDITVGEDEVAARRKEVEDRLREEGQGPKEEDAGSSFTARHLERELSRQIGVQKLEAAGVDCGKEVEAATVLSGLGALPGARPAELPRGVALTVNDRPILVRDLGDAILCALGARGVRETVDRACRIALAEELGARLSPKEMDVELEHLRALAPLESRFDPEPLWEEFKVLHGKVRHLHPTPAQVRTSPLSQSLLGLVRHFRATITPEEVQGAWEEGRRGLFGPCVRVLHVEITFDDGSTAFVPSTGRTRRDALKLARTIRPLLEEGLTVEALRRSGVVPEDVLVEERRVYATPQDLLLHQEAEKLEDGQVSQVFETLSEANLLRRLGAEPAPAFTEVEGLVRERLARDRMRQWLDEHLSDPKEVKRRWPL